MPGATLLQSTSWLKPPTDRRLVRRERQAPVADRTDPARSFAGYTRPPGASRLVASAAAGLQSRTGAVLRAAAAAAIPPQALGLLRRLHAAPLLLGDHRRPGVCRQHLRLHIGFRQQ